MVILFVFLFFFRPPLGTNIRRCVQARKKLGLVRIAQNRKINLVRVRKASANCWAKHENESGNKFIKKNFKKKKRRKKNVRQWKFFTWRKKKITDTIIMFSFSKKGTHFFQKSKNSSYYWIFVLNRRKFYFSE